MRERISPGKYVTPTTRTRWIVFFDGPFHSSKYSGEIEPGAALFCIAVMKPDHDNEVNGRALVMRPGHDRLMWVNPISLKLHKVELEHRKE